MTNAIYWLSFVANGDDPEQGRLLIGLPARNDADAWRAGLVQAALVVAGHECSAEYEVRSQIGPEEEGGMTVTRVITTRASVKLPEPPPEPGMTFGRDDLDRMADALIALGEMTPSERDLLKRITNHLNEGEQPHG